jgi:hypothetical protein
MEERRLAEQERRRNELRMEELRNEELKIEELRNQELRRKEQEREEPVTKSRRIVNEEAQGGLSNFFLCLIVPSVLKIDLASQALYFPFPRQTRSKLFFPIIFPSLTDPLPRESLLCLLKSSHM